MERMEQFRSLFKQILSKAFTDAPQEIGFMEYGGNEGDLVACEREREMDLKLKSHKDSYLKQVASALKKIDRGEFGLCSECGDEIESKRLEAKPIVCRCLPCQEELEKLSQKKSGSAFAYGPMEAVAISFGDEGRVYDKVHRFMKKDCLDIEDSRELE